MSWCNMCGPDARWHMDWDTGTLTIEGTGEIRFVPEFNKMDTYGEQGVYYFPKIRRIIISPGCTVIGKSCFRGLWKVESVCIPDTVTEICEQAFESCLELTSVIIPNSVRIIKDNAFLGCEKLETIDLPNSVEYFGEGVFSHCKEEFPYPYSCTIVENSVSDEGIAEKTMIISGRGHLNFWHVCKKQNISGYNADGFWEITDVVIEEGTTTLAAFSFEDGSGIRSIRLPESLQVIDTNSFSGCDTLTTIRIPAGVKWINGDPFFDCTGLKSIEVDERNPYYCSKDGCLFDKQMTELLRCPSGYTGRYVVPDQVAEIGNNAFATCKQLAEILLPDNIYKIGCDSFVFCTSLESIVLPDSLREISATFWGCTSLRSVNIPSGITTIPANMFQSCQQLVHVKLPDSLKYIEGNAFSGCSSLQDITLPAGLEQIGIYAFYDCTKLDHLEIPDSVTFIDVQAFHGIPCIAYSGPACSSSNWGAGNRIPVRDWEERRQSAAESGLSGKHFRWYRVGNTLYLEGTGKLNCDWSRVAFDGKRPSEVIEEIHLLPGCAQIGNAAFSGFSSLKKLVLPDGLETIGNWAFYGCRNLTEIRIPDSVTTVGCDAFNCISDFPVIRKYTNNHPYLWKKKANNRSF